MAATELIFDNADFSQSAVTNENWLQADDMVAGLTTDDCNLRTDQAIFLTRSTTVQTYNITDYDMITIANGMKVAVGLIDENGTAVCSAPVWLENRTGTDATYSIFDQPNYATYYGVKKFRVSFGWNSNATLSPDQFGSVAFAKLSKETELRLWSNYWTCGHMLITGQADRASTTGRLSLETPLRLERWSRISLPSTIQWGIVYSTLSGNYYPNAPFDAWTTTSGTRAITSSVKQAYSSCPGAQMFQIGIRRTDNNKLLPEMMNTTYTFKLLK